MNKFIGYYNISVIATYLGLLTAAGGIYLAFTGNAFAAVICLLAAGTLDMFDGKIARRCKRCAEEKSFGIQIDSLCDLVAFGVLPTCILLSGTCSSYSLICSAFFILCTLIRLAYFNVDEALRQSSTAEKRRHFLGVPVTATALIIPVIYTLRHLLGSAYPVILSIVLTALGIAFISKIKVPKPGLKSGMLLLLIGALEFAALMIFK